MDAIERELLKQVADIESIPVGAFKIRANGALESRAGWKGLIRKCMTLLAVLIGARLDILLGTAYIKDALVIAFCVNELLSIIENWGLMGLPMPKIMTEAVELLKAKGEGK